MCCRGYIVLYVVFLLLLCDVCICVESAARLPSRNYLSGFHLLFVNYQKKNAAPPKPKAEERSIRVIHVDPMALCAMAAAGVLAMLALWNGFIQWFALLSLPLLALYNGQRGKMKLKYLFYLYYPLHLAALYGISLLLK